MTDARIEGLAIETAESSTTVVWRQGAAGWIVLAAVAALIGFVFFDGIVELERIWGKREEYSHGYLIPLISAFLVWQKRDELERLEFRGALTGWWLCLASVALLMLGELSTLYVLVQYALVGMLAGLVLALTGWRGMRLLWVPVVFLVFMIPLPNFLYQKLSTTLQLLSSELGVAVIRLFGISVFLEGNVIDLGSYKLQVVEACNGLRYLFPLLSFGFLCAYLFRAPLWQRALVFLSAIPITVLMNSFRIGVIGFLVEHYGISMAEGFLHQFEGWFIFMACVAILMLEMWLLTRLFGKSASFREAFGLDFPAPTPDGAETVVRSTGKMFLAGAVLLVPAAAVVLVLGEREEVEVEREQFVAFPEEFEGWKGRQDTLGTYYLKELKLTDYVLADYRNGGGDWVNLYAAYYGSQRKGQSAHSPASCIPGGGWEIVDISPVTLPDLSAANQALRVNRVQIQKGQNRQLVYYWFQQRGRIMTSEYRVKAYLLLDSMRINRTDGAMVRLTTMVRPGETWEAGDNRLARFARALEGRLEPHIPS